MTEEAREKLTVRAAPERCFEIAVDFDRYPEWAPDIKEVRVIERDEQGRGLRVAYRTAAFGRSTSYTLAYNYEKAPWELSWVEETGDLTRRLDGSYTFEPSGADTEVGFHLLVDLIVPIPGFVKRRAEVRIMHTALRHLKDRAEKG